jgi:hypothetical protein
VIKWWLKPYLRDPSKSMAHHLRDANSNAIFEPHNSEKFHIMSINVGWWFWLLRARKDILTSCWTSQGALWPRYALVPISNYYYIIIKVYETWEFDRDCVSSFVLPSCLMQPDNAFQFHWFVLKDTRLFLIPPTNQFVNEVHWFLQRSAVIH